MGTKGVSLPLRVYDKLAIELQYMNERISLEKSVHLYHVRGTVRSGLKNGVSIFQSDDL